MSQHADLVKFEVAKGIKRDLSFAQVVEDIMDLLDVLEYDISWTNETSVSIDVEQTARYMLTQLEFLYGVSYRDITEFLKKAGRIP